MDETNLIYWQHGNSTGTFRVGCHVCRQVAAHVRYLCHPPVWRL